MSNPEMSNSEMNAPSQIIEMPMFPLGSVLLPDGVLPLHIFEARYQQLLNHSLESDRRFGVTLITRGSEVGGGEVRVDVGTAATIEDYQRFDDGRAAVMSRGGRRFRVVEWLEDDPYPRARIQEFDDEAEGRNDRDLIRTARESFDALIELGQKLGRLESAPRTDWVEDLESASWQLAGLVPCTPLDQYSMLSAATRAERLTLIDELLRDVYNDLDLMGGLDSSS